MLTTDVCDQCWGSGEKHRKGADLRRIDAEIAALKAELAAAREHAKKLHEEDAAIIHNFASRQAALRARLKEAMDLLQQAAPALRSVVPVDSLVNQIRAFLDAHKENQ